MSSMPDASRSAVRLTLDSGGSCSAHSSARRSFLVDRRGGFSLMASTGDCAAGRPDKGELCSRSAGPGSAAKRPDMQELLALYLAQRWPVRLSRSSYRTSPSSRANSARHSFLVLHFPARGGCHQGRPSRHRDADSTVRLCDMATGRQLGTLAPRWSQMWATFPLGSAAGRGMLGGPVQGRGRRAGLPCGMRHWLHMRPVSTVVGIWVAVRPAVEGRCQRDGLPAGGFSFITNTGTTSRSVEKSATFSVTTARAADLPGSGDRRTRGPGSTGDVRGGS